MAEEKGGGLPVNDALNKPTSKLGLDYRVAGACVGVGIIVALFLSLLFGIVLMFVLPIAARLALRRDPQVYRLWCLSFLQGAYYDPGKVRR